MTDAAVSVINVQPVFDLEDFMNFSKETRISSEALDHIGNLFNQWNKLIQARKVDTGKNSWVIVWMPEEAERYIDEKWVQSPGEGFLYNMLAQYMCMTAVEELIPQTAGNGCAPLPDMKLPLVQALAKLGLLDKNTNNIIRRYHVLTWYPFGGGCEICSLQNGCPKLKGSENMHSWVLPGHEKG